MNKTTILACIALAAETATAQQTISYTNPDKSYFDGREMFDLRHFNTAFRYLEGYVDGKDDNRNPYYADAQYYLASSAYEMGRKDAMKRLDNFSQLCPFSPHINRVRFMKGALYFQKQQYAEASEQFSNCKSESLNAQDRAEYLFDYGFSELQNCNYEKARKCFSQLAEMKNGYQLSAQYYTAYIDYLNQDYDQALPVFLELQQHSEYQSTVPYYITQIYYAKGMTDKVLEYGLDIVEKYPQNANNAEVYRLIGESYFNKKDYDNAIKYLSIYEQRIAKIYRNDAYMLGVSYYQKGKYNEAIERLKKATVIEDDAMAQNAYLYLGSSYLKLNDKTSARMSFGQAASMSIDKNVQEESLYNYALIVYEQSKAPFNESVTAFEKFLETFPGSKYTESVYSYLINIYMTTKNYQAAYTSIQKIKTPNKSVLEARQHIEYFMGIQEFIDGNFQDAIDWLTKSLSDRQYNYDTEALSLFWRGEAYFRNNQTDKASADFTDFLSSVGARNSGQYNTAHYNLGYCYFKNHKYSNALSWFRKYVNLETQNKNLIYDAYNRIGDCYYNARDLTNAQNNYAKVSAHNGAGSDYALYQQGFIKGLQKDYNGKIEILNKLIATQKQSEYQPDAMFEIGKAYTFLKENEKAINEYELIIRNFFHSPQARRARLQIAMLYDGMNKNDEAIKYYKQIIDLYPSSVEAKTAIEDLQQVYFDKNDIDSYAEYIKSLGGIADFSEGKQDSLTFRAAEQVYQRGEYDKAATSLKSYVEKYPNSVFNINARYELGVSYSKINKNSEAKKEFEIVSKSTNSWYPSAALNHLAQIQYDEQDYKGCIRSNQHLVSISQKADVKFKAQATIMRCYNSLSMYDSTIVAASAVIKDGKLDPNVMREAYYLRAKSYEKKNDMAPALADYNVLSKNLVDKYGAEANYRVAEYLFYQGDINKAKETANTYIESADPEGNYWWAKCAILMSDICMKEGDDFSAKQWLNQLKGTYGESGKNDGIDAAIKSRLDEISNQEAKKVKK